MADARGRLVLAAARGLHANGQASGETIEAVRRLGTALGLRATVLLHWGELLLLTETSDGQTALLACDATPSAVGMNRVAALMRSIEGVTASGVAGAEAAIATAGAKPPAGLTLFVFSCAAGASALALIFGAVHVQSVALIALSAAAGALLRRHLARFGAGPAAQAFAGALVAGLAGALAVRLGESSALRLVAICPCMILVPGPHILNGALDLIALRIPLGASRLTFAALVLLAICAGLLVGLGLGGATFPVSEPGRHVPLWIDTIAAGVAVACYGIFFSMPLRMLTWPVVVGMIAHALRWWVMTVVGVGPALGAGTACLLVGAVMAPLAKRHRLPFAAVGFASVVSLMPGIYIFRMSDAFVQMQVGAPPIQSALLADAASDAVTSMLIVFAMILGLVLPKTLHGLLTRRNPAG